MPDEQLLERLRALSFEAYCRSCIRIVDKRRETVPFEFNDGQAAFEAKIKRRFIDQGRAVRAIILKARQIGFSTQTQARMIRGCTLYPNRHGLVVAHEKEAAGGLFGIGQGMYSRLEQVPELKPQTRYHTRQQFIHFAPPERDAWLSGDLFPDSKYQVDTANEAETGRSKTYDYLHLSEVAFWANVIKKLTALLQTVPDEPHTWIILESTANGANLFKDEWDKAVSGESDYLAFFWPWWKEPSYSLPFANEAEHAAFKPGRGRYSEGERELLDPGPVDYETGEHVPLTLEQLNWRRMVLRRPAMTLDLFQQEYPATPEEAFIASGRTRFDQKAVSQILVSIDVTDPGIPDKANPGPILGGFRAGATDVIDSPRGTGKIEVPKDPIWVPEGEWTGDPWKLWLPRDAEGMPSLAPVSEREGKREVAKRRQFIGGVDVSGGQMEEGATETDWHAIEFIDHRTREQVAEYRSHEDPDLLAAQLYLAALYFGEPEIAVEVTGGWGLPVARKLYFDYRYRFVYIRTRLEGRAESEDDRLGWSTSRATKPILESNMDELLRAGIPGLVKSRELAHEFRTYVRDEKGRTGAEAGKHDDLLIALMIAHQVAEETPLRPEWWNTGKAPQIATPEYDLYR